MPTATWPIPGQEQSQVRSAQSARSYEGIEHPAKPTAARRSWPRWSSTALLDHLIRAQQHRLRDREPERLRRLQVDHQLELRGLLDGKIGGLDALKDLIHVASATPQKVGVVGPIRH